MTGSPLVDQGDPLTDEELERYSRQLRMPEIGLEGQRRITNARVLVIGAGGLGSPVILYLAAAGVGTIGVVDDDTVVAANLHRQILHSTATLGESKLASAHRAVTDLNPLVTLAQHDVRLDETNARQLIDGYDLVVDGSDTFATRYAVSDATADAGIPHVWGSVLRGDGQVSVFWERGDDESRTLRDLFPASVDDGATCELAGVVGPLCGTVGSILATEALKLIVGFGEPLRGRVLIVDALDASTAVVPFSRRAIPPASASSREEISMDEQESITVEELAELLRAREAGEREFVFVDIRESFEREIVAVEGSLHIPLQGLLGDDARAAMPQESTLVLMCHHDSRSAYARAVLAQEGWEDVRFVEGGIHAWATRINPSLRTY